MLIIGGAPVQCHLDSNGKCKSKERPYTIGLTIFPSGSTTTKNRFVGPAIAGCSAPSLTMDSLAILEPASE
jgi:hypothetical protein